MSTEFQHIINQNSVSMQSPELSLPTDLDAEVEAVVDDVVAPVAEPQVAAGLETRFVTGPAGTGKTTLFRNELAADPASGILCSTTGISAVNLGTVTLNSVLGFFDTDSLADSYSRGALTRKMGVIAKTYRALKIDEVSMMDALQLDLITQAALEWNERGEKPIAIHLTGDFCQLPPVKGKWAFKAESWKRYSASMTRLDKIMRQDAPEFIAALNLARAGNGKGAAEAFRGLAKWAAGVDNQFEGTTIMAKNDEVDRYNKLRYMQLAGTEQRFATRRWGRQRKEWEKLVPDVLPLKPGAYVMILANSAGQVNAGGGMLYANGDCGWVVDFGTMSVRVKLARNGDIVEIPYLTRYFDSKDAPDSGRSYDAAMPYFDEARQRWIVGSVTYVPLRLAYAATVHKTQGLTLDNVQVDIRGHFFGSPSMAYVALSRVRSAKGLRIVGSPELLAVRVKTSPEVQEWV